MPYGIEVNHSTIHIGQVVDRLLVGVRHITRSGGTPALEAVALAGESVGGKVLSFIIREVLISHSTGNIGSVSIKMNFIGVEAPCGEEVVVRQTLVGSHLGGYMFKCGILIVFAIVSIVPQEVGCGIGAYGSRGFFIASVPAEEGVARVGTHLRKGRNIHGLVDIQARRTILAHNCLRSIMFIPDDVRGSGFFDGNIHRLELHGIGSFVNSGMGFIRRGCARLRIGYCQNITCIGRILPFGNHRLGKAFQHGELGARKHRFAWHILVSGTVPALDLPV